MNSLLTLQASLGMFCGRMSNALQEIVEKVIDPHESRVWLARMRGRRFDVMWSVGEVRTDPYEKLTRVGPYFLIGQHVEEQSRDKLVGLFANHMVENTYAVPEE